MVNTVTITASIKGFVSPTLTGAAGMHVHLDPQSPNLLRDDAGPCLIDHKRVTGYIRSDGRMYDTAARSAPPNDVADPGRIGVTVLAGIAYTVTFEQPGDGTRQTFRSFSIGPLPATPASVDLTTLTPAPATAVAPLAPVWMRC